MNLHELIKSDLSKSHNLQSIFNEKNKKSQNMDWERFLQDGVVPLEKSLDDSHYHEKGISPSVSPIPAAASSLTASKYQYQSDEEEKELRRMKKGKAK